MPNRVSAVILAEPEYARGRLILLRFDPPDTHYFVWCGRSMGWLPLKTTSSVFHRVFASEDEARKAADKYITLPVQE